MGHAQRANLSRTWPKARSQGGWMHSVLRRASTGKESEGDRDGGGRREEERDARGGRRARRRVDKDSRWGRGGGKAGRVVAGIPSPRSPGPGNNVRHKHSPPPSSRGHVPDRQRITRATMPQLGLTREHQEKELRAMLAAFSALSRIPGPAIKND